MPNSVDGFMVVHEERIWEVEEILVCEKIEMLQFHNDLLGKQRDTISDDIPINLSSTFYESRIE